MIESLLGLPYKIKLLLDRLTPDRAAKLDNVNDTITSRAPASSALTNQVWTDALAAKLGGVRANLPPVVALNHVQEAISTTDYPILYNGSFQTNGTASTTYVDLVNVQGAGYIAALFFVTSSSTVGGNIQLIVDGVTLFSGYTQSSRLRVLVGNTTITSVLPVFPYTVERNVLQLQDGFPIYFSSSLMIRVASLHTSDSQAIYYRLFRTG